MVFQLTTLAYLICSMLLSQSRLQETSLIGRAAEPQATTLSGAHLAPLYVHFGRTLCTFNTLMGIFYQFDPALDWGRNLNFSPLA